jgi:hypothetical protein
VRFLTFDFGLHLIRSSFILYPSSSSLSILNIFFYLFILIEDRRGRCIGQGGRLVDCCQSKVWNWNRDFRKSRRKCIHHIQLVPWHHTNIVHETETVCFFTMIICEKNWTKTKNTMQSKSPHTWTIAYRRLLREKSSTKLKISFYGSEKFFLWCSRQCHNRHNLHTSAITTFLSFLFCVFSFSEPELEKMVKPSTRRDR